jgi:hypothetical protein
LAEEPKKCSIRWLNVHNWLNNMDWRSLETAQGMSRLPAEEKTRKSTEPPVSGQNGIYCPVSAGNSLDNLSPFVEIQPHAALAIINHNFEETYRC